LHPTLANVLCMTRVCGKVLLGLRARVGALRPPSAPTTTTATRKPVAHNRKYISRNGTASFADGLAHFCIRATARHRGMRSDYGGKFKMGAKASRRRKRLDTLDHEWLLNPHNKKNYVHVYLMHSPYCKSRVKFY